MTTDIVSDPWFLFQKEKVNKPLDKMRMYAYNMRIILIFAVYYEKRKEYI